MDAVSCCISPNGLGGVYDEINEICTAQIPDGSGGTYEASFDIDNACSYVQQQAQSGGGITFNFENFADGLSDILDSVGGLLGGFAGLGSVPNPQTATQSQLDAARQTRVILGFVILLSLIVLGVVLSRRKR